jgi:hypothetical protein
MDMDSSNCTDDPAFALRGNKSTEARQRRYRCSYTPRDAIGHLNSLDTGAAPYVQFLAADAEQALDLAQKVTGCPVIEATRIEG